jgi:two-component system nitrogen regulation response regulator GlnG
VVRMDTDAPVWVVDDDRAIRWVLSRALSRAGIASREFDRPEKVLEALGRAHPQALISDIRMPGMSGVEMLTRIRESAPEVPVIIMTAYSDLESAVSAFQGGAFEYLAKPFDVKRAVELIERAMRAGDEARRREEEKAQAAAPAEKPAVAPGAGEGASVPDLIGHAPAMQDVFRAIGRLSQSSVTVLLTGESGTGKEVVARAIWRHSQRADKPYIAINMAAIPKELLESELFGHEKGAFTGATSLHLGRFEQAKGGTLFLDEIGDMPMEMQTRLLRVLSNGYFYRVGGREPIKADVRIIAATNQDLEKRVREGLFREDLYHRLNVIRLRLPPLRNSVEDIGPLAEHFLSVGARELGVEPRRLTPAALHRLEMFRFPGNVRQLENLCRWLLVMAPSAEIRPEDLPDDVLQGTQAPAAPAAQSAGAAAAAGAGPSGDWKALLAQEAKRRLLAGESGIWGPLSADFESTVIRAALETTHGRRIEAAQRLGLGRNTVTRKIQEFEHAK